MAGSSPRLRGTADRGQGPGVEVRFIPAPAGNSSTPNVSRFQASGSSPRLRGTASPSGPPGRCQRFIPAPAGNRQVYLVKAQPATVHPRACGEQKRGKMLSKPVAGSSPRLRGTDRAHHRGPRHRRFIPAPAGNREQFRHRTRSRPVHPRACGEQGVMKVICDCEHGSSPRLRGTVVAAFFRVALRRFIPAPAGNRQMKPLRWICITVHPRACGEQSDAW